MCIRDRGHINHGTAVAYFEDARVRHAHDIGLFPYDTDKFPFIVASMTFNFLKQIKNLKESHPIWLKFDTGMNRLGFSIEDSSIIFVISK